MKVSRKDLVQMGLGEVVLGSICLGIDQGRRHSSGTFRSVLTVADYGAVIFWAWSMAIFIVVFGIYKVEREE